MDLASTQNWLAWLKKDWSFPIYIDMTPPPTPIRSVGLLYSVDGSVSDLGMGPIILTVVWSSVARCARLAAAKASLPRNIFQ